MKLIKTSCDTDSSRKNFSGEFNRQKIHLEKYNFDVSEGRKLGQNSCFPIFCTVERRYG